MRYIPLLALSVALTQSIAFASDSAASLAPSGLVIGRESHITIARQILRVRPSLVTEDDDFRNDSDADITTEVAFVVPDFSPLGFNERHREPGGEQRFGNFHLWVDEKPVEYVTETKAVLGDKEDYTAVLQSAGIDIADFKSPSEESKRRWGTLSAEQKDHLQRAFDPEFGFPGWTVRMKLYWRQTFPARRIVHIRHDYTPELGTSQSVWYGIHPEKGDADSIREINSVCLQPEVRASLAKLSDDIMSTTQHLEETPYLDSSDFLLTTANTWRTPIEDFTLIVDSPPATPSRHTLISFCWAGPVTNSSAGEIVAHVSNFIPTNELRIGFITVLDRP